MQMHTVTPLEHDQRADELRKRLYRAAIDSLAQALPTDCHEWTIEQLRAGATVSVAITIPTGEIECTLRRGERTDQLFRVIDAVGGNA